MPKPLPEAIKGKHFGEDESGKPVSPSPAKIRAITENHAEKLIELLDTIRGLDRQLAAGCSDRARLESERNWYREKLKERVNLYAGSFGQEAAERLGAYARRQVLIRDDRSITRS